MNQKTVKYEKFDAVEFYDAERPFKDHWSYPELDTRTIRFEKGQVVKEGFRPLCCDMILEKDTPVKMRDGITIYADVYRPTDESQKYPLLINYSPYGKIDTPNFYTGYENNANLDLTKLTGLEAMECAQPDSVVVNGYAFAVVDSRGTTNSEGDMMYFGNQEGRDIYDTIEFLATQDWCDGNVGMMGNSWLAICQYFVAALQPPHLKAIAPWEGMSDLMHDVILRGGIPTLGFIWGINSMMRYNDKPENQGLIENVLAMAMKYPTENAYWMEEKRPDFDKITVPAYFVSSYDSNVHSNGTIRAFNKIASKEKWLRYHNTQEWYDQYSPHWRADLFKFFDHYLKGVDNGWENTPKVRLALFDTTGSDIVGQVEEAFPVPRTEYRKLYLDSRDQSMSETLPTADASCSYYAEDGKGEEVRFRFKVTEEMQVAGYCRMKLYVSTDEGDDLDIFAYVLKEDQMKEEYLHPMLNVKHYGAEAMLRASCRRILNDELVDFYHQYADPQKVAPGEIVELETVFWPTGQVFHEGEYITVVISSKCLRQIEFPAPPVPTINHGNHTVYSGPAHPSYLEIPVI